MQSSVSVIVLLTLFCSAPLESYGKEDLTDSNHAPYNILSSSSIGKPGLVSAGSDDDDSEFPIHPPEHPTLPPPEHPSFPPWVSHPPPEHPSFPPWVSHPPPEHHFPSPPPWFSHPPPPERHHAPPPPPPHEKPPPPEEHKFPPPPPPHHLPPPPAPPPHFPAATLADLKISKGKLSPKFDPKVHNYSASVGSGVKKIRITAVVPEHEGKDEYTVTVNSIPVKSGVPSPQLRVGKAGKTVLFEVTVTALEHEPSTYYLSVHRGKSKWSSFGAKFLLALAIILIIAVVAFLAYAIYVCVKTGRMPTFWPFSYFARDRGGDEYTSLGPGPSRP